MADEQGPSANWHCLSAGGCVPSRAKQRPIGIQGTALCSHQWRHTITEKDPGPFNLLNKENFLPAQDRTQPLNIPGAHLFQDQ